MFLGKTAGFGDFFLSKTPLAVPVPPPESAKPPGQKGESLKESSWKESAAEPGTTAISGSAVHELPGKSRRTDRLHPNSHRISGMRVLEGRGSRKSPEWQNLSATQHWNSWKVSVYFFNWNSFIKDQFLCPLLPPREPRANHLCYNRKSPEGKS